ncbi:MAG: 2-hydroxychromene-2-carboxylate isomerase [Deltaproteobacteria bacterium]|nr:2-hydroxychromene-2-carboxylate isomerase [Deltaproteobacteria bacterium]
MRSLELFIDYTCPYAYLASVQAEAAARRAGAALSWRPFLLGGVFKAVGTPQRLFEALSPAKARHNGLDMARWAARHGVPLRMPEGHPYRSVEALRATLAAGCDPAVIHGFYRAYWAQGRPVSDPETLRAVLTDAGHDAAEVLARADAPATREALREATDRAIALGVFGAPALLVDGAELYWGQDRLAMALGEPPVTDATPRPRTGRVLELYWDFSSPFAYLASAQAEALAARTGAALVHRPMLLGGLFKALGQDDVPLLSFGEARQRYYHRDLERLAAWWGVPFRFPSRFPLRTVLPLRVYLALPEARRGAFRHGVFRAAWAEDRDVSDPAVLTELLGDGAAEVLLRASTDEVKSALRSATDRALAEGVFGAPTWVVDGTELFWGQDRIPLVESALTT